MIETFDEVTEGMRREARTRLEWVIEEKRSSYRTVGYCLLATIFCAMAATLMSHPGVIAISIIVAPIFLAIAYCANRAALDWRQREDKWKSLQQRIEAMAEKGPPVVNDTIN